ncbi:hypothetical protein [Bosea sp. (in: a-proteobacteria)]|jgi:hypothetical protein|uniref:hypothetical protein n=1 Tax=Bosea sp. (in: a-proteobacteria) TaxID=1871050 RepID=UPI002DDD9DE1|nr:hypothetical protein [Bosea sp. (in: a-proteobacteria)]HEV2509678.1 hypothetical protein [Bosea sp. (in: a-proteobacteria)]
MVKRSKRSLYPSDAAAMQEKVRAFHWEVRKWCGDIPLGSTVYVALEGLNSALELASRQLNGALDDARRDPAGYGRNGLEDF